MFLPRLKAFAAAVASVGVVSAGARFVSFDGKALAQAEAKAPVAQKRKPNLSPSMDLREKLQLVHWYLVKVHRKEHSLDLFADLTRSKLADPTTAGSLLSLDGVLVAENAKVFIDGKESKLIDLKPMMRLHLQLAKDSSTVTRIEATKGEIKLLVSSVNAGKRTISVILPTGLKLDDLPVAKNAEIMDLEEESAGDGPDPATMLTALKAGMAVSLKMSVLKDQLVITSIKYRGTTNR